MPSPPPTASAPGSCPPTWRSARADRSSSRRRRLRPGAVHAGRRQRVARRRRLPAAGAGRPAHRVRHPDARRRRRAHRRHPRLLRLGAARTVRAPGRPCFLGRWLRRCGQLPRSSSPRGTTTGARDGCTTSLSPTNSTSSTRPPSAPWNRSQHPHRDAATCSRANASMAPRSIGASHETSTSTMRSPGAAAIPFDRTPPSRQPWCTSFDIDIVLRL